MAGNDNMDSSDKYNYTWRATCAQLLTLGAIHTMMVNVGLIIAAPSVVIGALHQRASVNGTSPDARHHDSMVFTEAQESWFGSLLFLVQPLGSVASGVLQERLGRKRCFYLVNALQFVTWLAMSQATTVSHLFAGITLLGLTIGFEEAPGISYLGEVMEPRLRGLGSSSVGIFYNLGYILQTALGWAFPDDWRRVLRLAAIGPAVSVVALWRVPESPTWLVSKGRIEEARAAYRCLRGWVPADDIQKELDQVIAYVQKSRAGYPADVGNGRVKASRVRLLLSPPVQRPMFLLIAFFFISNCCALTPVRPYIVPLIEEMQISVDGEMANFLAALLALAGSVVSCAAIPLFGKRRLSFTSLAICVFGCLGLALCLAPTGPVPTVHRPSIILVLFSLVIFSGSIGILLIPWILISELFPLRAKGLASGVAAAAGYLLSFALTVSYLPLRAALSDWGALLAYGAVGLPGALYLYRTLPETEGVPLERTERIMMRDLDAKGVLIAKRP